MFTATLWKSFPLLGLKRHCGDFSLFVPKVSPTEIEDELLKHPSVTECSVVGVPDQKTGEAPKAFVILKEKATVDDLQKFLAPRLSKHKQLRGGITFVESLPKSESGKVLRKVLRTMT